jgi:hypothetical protein
MALALRYGTSTHFCVTRREAWYTALTVTFYSREPFVCCVTTPAPNFHHGLLLPLPDLLVFPPPLAPPAPPHILTTCSHPHTTTERAHSHGTESTTARKMANITQDNENDNTSTAAQPCAAELVNVVTPKDADPNPL